jgi:hypothetical protein
MLSGMVSEHDRAAMRRQAVALDDAPAAGEGSLAWRSELIAWIDDERRRAGQPDLDTEPELHRRAVALGLVRRVP